MSPIWLRILLAMYLAIWSPAMCCCGVREVLAVASGVDGGTCHRLPDALPDADLNRPAAHSCCASVASTDTNAATTNCGAQATESSDRPACHCHESPDLKTRFDSGGKVALPGFAKLLPTFVAWEFTPSVQVTFVHGFSRHLWPPGFSRFASAAGNRTLLDQHCLLRV